VGQLGTGCLSAVGASRLSGRQLRQIDDPVQVAPATSGGPQAPPAGAGRRPGQLWLSPSVCVVTTRGLAREPQACLPTVHRGRSWPEAQET